MTITVNVGISTNETDWEKGPAVTIDPANYKTNQDLIVAIQKAQQKSSSLTNSWQIDGSEESAFVDISVQGEFPGKAKLEYQLNDFADTLDQLLPMGSN